METYYSGFTVAEIKAIAGWLKDWEYDNNKKIVLKNGFEDKYLLLDEDEKTVVVKMSDIMSDIYGYE